ncbi:Oligopeptide-binding protein oppA [Borrelia hermsii YBT]|nr:Oligopeptide-binding protein oppA [Borrelia hermsii YBT]
MKKYGQKWTSPENLVVSCAFKLYKRVPNDKLVLVKNDKYYDAVQVELDELVFYTVNNSSSSYRMYENDEIDMLTAGAIPPEAIKEIKFRSDYYTFPLMVLYYLTFNTTLKPLDNAKVRESLTLSIDRKTLTSKVVDNGSIATRKVSPTFNNYSYGKELTLFDSPQGKKITS